MKTGSGAPLPETEAMLGAVITRSPLIVWSTPDTSAESPSAGEVPFTRIPQIWSAVLSQI